MAWLKRLLNIMYLGVPGLLLILSACVTQSDPMSELRQNQRKWTLQNIANYRYTLRIGCFCPPEIREPMEIEVRNGTAISITPVNPEISVNTQFFEHANTIPKLFDIIHDAYDDEADEMSVSYDENRGYPVYIFIDLRKGMADEEIAYSISNFEILEEL